MIKRKIKRRIEKKVLDNQGENMVYEPKKQEDMSATVTEPVTEDQIMAKSRNIDKVNTEKKPGTKAEVYTEKWVTDQTAVINKDPDMTYVWGRADCEQEMILFASKGYSTALGDEVCFGMKEPNPGKPKMMPGNRILMCCPKDKVDARNQEMVGRLNAQLKGGNAAQAKSLQQQVGRAGVVKEYKGDG